MRNDLKEITIPFPGNLMATAQSPLVLPLTYARDLTNMLLGADGSGSKRGGVNPVGSEIAGEVITGLFSYQHSSGVQLLAFTDAGKIYRQNGAAWVQLYSSLNPLGVPQGVLFAGKLVLANGLNAVMQYDGTAVTLIEKRVKDAGANLTLLSTTQYRLDSDAAFYPVGSTVQVKVAGADITATVSSATQSGVQTTIMLTAAVLTGALTESWFTVRPPMVATLAVAHDRLWGFGAGGFRPTLGTEADRLRVYYTHSVNDAAAWPDPATGIIPSLNLADKAGVADELLAMRVKDGLTVFMGRQHIQLWEGTTPGTAGGLEADFGWVKTLPVGLLHPRGVMDLPNDLLIITPLGARTLSRTLQTEQLDLADVGRAIDPTLAESFALLTSNAGAYRSLQSFTCPAQGWFGLGFEAESFIWQVAAAGQGWVRFTGAFAGLSSTHTATNGSLYIAKGGQVFVYDTALWADAGEPIATRWWLPWFMPAAKRRWANKYLEVLAVPQTEQQLTLKRSVNLDDGNPTVLPLTLPAPADYWDGASWDAALFDNATAAPALVRDHAVAERFGLSVESNHIAPLKVLGLRLHGTPES